MQELLETFLSLWPVEKEESKKIISENKSFNKALKKNLDELQYEKDRRKFSFKSLEGFRIIIEKIPSLLYDGFGVLKSKYQIQGSIGKGNLSDIPWICIFDRDLTQSAQEGYFIVYLFHSLSKGVYLSLNQGYTQYLNEYGIVDGKLQIKNTSAYLKRVLRSIEGFDLDDINLGSDSDLAKGYELGNICSKFYTAGSVPSSEILLNDLRNLIGIYRELKGFVGKNILD